MKQSDVKRGAMASGVQWRIQRCSEREVERGGRVVRGDVGTGMRWGKDVIPRVLTTTTRHKFDA